MCEWRPGARLVAAIGWLAIIVLARAGVGAPARLLTPVAAAVAAVVQTLLGWIGIHTVRAGSQLYVPGSFGYEVGIGCTGLLPVAVLVVAVLTTPATRVERRRGLVIGVPLVLLVNLVRLVHLFYLGMYAPWLFAPAHEAVWEAVMVLVTFGIWATWLRSMGGQRRAIRPESN